MATDATRPRTERSSRGRAAARFEFRVWCPPADVVERIEQLPSGGPPGEKNDVYLVGSAADVNAKLRDSTLEVKHLVERVGALERWSPAWSADLPVAPHTVGRLSGELQLRTPNIDDSRVTESQLRRMLGESGGCVVPAFKRRRKFECGRAQVEVVDVTFFTRTLRSVAVEAVDESIVRDSIEALGLHGENRPMHLAAARSARR